MNGTRTVTFLFTDIEGSTRLWDESPSTMGPALARHDALLREAIAVHGGETFKTVGDAFCAAFSEAPRAAAAALAAQAALVEEAWGTPRPIRVRMALHTGAAETRDGDYFGPPLNRVARLLATAHGGQTLLSGASYELVRDVLPSGAFLSALGDHRLKDLARPEAIYALLHSDLPQEFPPLRSLDSAALPNNLPEQTTSFVGREKELIEVAAGLKRARLLTLVGPGGTGKTRLALQASAEAIDAFPGGVWLVELASLDDPTLVPQTVAGAMCLTEEAGRPLAQTIVECLRTSSTLLVFDNCEHLLDATARLADSLVRAVPNLRILATSREPLGIGGESVYRVPTLSLPKPTEKHTVESLSQYEAVRLFLDRATAQRADFVVTNANVPALASLCLHLDGIPLAIELAAARVRSLTIEGIESRLDDRFRLLTGGSRTALPRQQTLRALIEWSHDLLNEAERTAFRRIAAFAGGCTIEAAESVVAGSGIEEWEVLDLLASLVDKSLVGAEESNGGFRYGMLESVRHYAQERLKESGEEAQCFARHADYFMGLATEQGPRCHESGTAVRALSAEWDNLRAALDRGTAAQRLVGVGALNFFWSAKGAYREGLERAEAALREDDPPSGDERRCDALRTAAWSAFQVGNLVASAQQAEEAAELARSLGDSYREASALNTGALATLGLGRLSQARERLEAALRIKDHISLWNNLAGVLVNSGDFDAAENAVGQCGALLEKAPNVYFDHAFHQLRGWLNYVRGNVAEAEKDYEIAAARAKEMEGAELQASAKVGLSNCRRSQGRLDDALLLAREAVAEANGADTKEPSLLAQAQTLLAMGDPVRARDALMEYRRFVTPLYLLDGLDAIVALLALTDRPREASTLAAASAAERRRRPMPVPPVALPEHERRITGLRETLGEVEFARTATEGEAMGIDSAKAYALTALG